MKKTIIGVLCLIFVMGMFTSCGEMEPTKSGITGEEILGGFEQYLTGSELADHYQIARPPATDIPDSDEIRHDLVITDIIDGYVYELKVWCNPEGYALGVVLSTTNAEYERLAFPTFCLYMCQAMKLSMPDWYAFCEDLGLLAGSSRGSMTVDGWNISAMSGEDMLALNAFFRPE